MDNQSHRPTLLDVPVSVFTTRLDNQPEGVTTLRRIVSTKHYRPLIEAIRREPDKLKQKDLKDKLRALAPVALLYHRKGDTSFADKISTQWPLLTGDIDQKDNPGVDMSELKKHLARLPYVLLCAYSVRGGLWFVVRLPDHQTPESLAAHFRYLQKLFSEIFGVELDSSKGSNPTALRYVSYDVNPYFNEDATVMRGTYTPPPPPRRTVNYTRLNGQGEVGLLCRIVGSTQAATEGNRHITLRNQARLAGGYIAADRLEEATVVCALETVASEWPDFKKSQGTIRDGIRYGLAKPLYAEDRNGLSERIDQATSHPRFQTQPPAPVVEQVTFPPLQECRNEADPKATALQSLVEVLDLRQEEVTPLVEVDPVAATTADGWDIDELELFFASIVLPPGPIKISKCETITDLPKFVESHLNYVRHNNGRRAYLPYLERLQQLKNAILATP